MKVGKVLVPLDGSPLAEMALPTAIELLRDSPDATLALLRAVAATTLPGVDPIEAQAAVVGGAEPYLGAVAARLRGEGRPILLVSAAGARAETRAVRASPAATGEDTARRHVLSRGRRS